MVSEREEEIRRYEGKTVLSAVCELAMLVRGKEGRKEKRRNMREKREKKETVALVAFVAFIAFLALVAFVLSRRSKGVEGKSVFRRPLRWKESIASKKM